MCRNNEKHSPVLALRHSTPHNEPGSGHDELCLGLRGEHLSPGCYSGPCFGWQFSDALALAEIIECPGELGLFHLSHDIAGRVIREIEKTDHHEFVKFVCEALAHLP
jgi:hypothetical protein